VNGIGMRTHQSHALKLNLHILGCWYNNANRVPWHFISKSVKYISYLKIM